MLWRWLWERSSRRRARAEKTDPRLPELFEALRLAPDENAALHAERAITKLWHQGGAPDLASIVDVERTLELEPRHFGALAGRGEIRFTSGQLHDALKAFKRALAVHPHLPRVKYRVGMLREKLGQVTNG